MRDDPAGDQVRVLPHAGVLALVPDDWSDAWQRRHQILSRLAALLPVAWISPARHWRSWPSGPVSRDRHLRSPTPADAPMFVLESTDDLPTVYHPQALRRAILRRRVRRGLQWLQRRGCRTIELQIWDPQFAEVLDWVPHTTSSYHIDDEYSWSTDERPMSPVERRLITRVDRVYVTSGRLLETKGGINPQTIFSPNGVDFRAFSAPATEPRDLREIGHPRVGYVGVLKEQLDWGLLTTLATNHPLWSFVFVGPVRAEHDTMPALLAPLRRLANVHFAGERSATALPGYLWGMDVALLPYRVNAYTECINPLKLYEALAVGVPIVASRIRTVREFAPAVALAEGVDEWTNGIAAALGEASHAADRRAQRQALARAYDWDAIVQPIAQAIGQKPETAGRGHCDV